MDCGLGSRSDLLWMIFLRRFWRNSRVDTAEDSSVEEQLYLMSAVYVMGQVQMSIMIVLVTVYQM